MIIQTTYVPIYLKKKIKKKQFLVRIQNKEYLRQHHVPFTEALVSKSRYKLATSSLNTMQKV